MGIGAMKYTKLVADDTHKKGDIYITSSGQIRISGKGIAIVQFTHSARTENCGFNEGNPIGFNNSCFRKASK